MNAAGPTDPRPAPAGSRVLLVEDHLDTSTVITLLLKKFGHSVDTADTVKGGVEKFAAGAYDVVLSDLGLPDGTGIDFIRRVREVSAVPAVALTGYGMEDDVRRCTEAGFNAHLTKPVNFAELDALIRRLVAPAA